ncbi:hypothetical protein ACQKIE_09240 [Luteibacter sp. NPDC031894]|jgi:hypothetical protein|uniref:hypothetical protein n=1 Tax=Luteibacter sp. NPDC031894 TaxID=3390572 RepID=UPI003D0905D8
MQREPGKRDYGSADCAYLRSLASRGVIVPQPTKPSRQVHPDGPRAERRREPRGPRTPA